MRKDNRHSDDRGATVINVIKYGFGSVSLDYSLDACFGRGLGGNCRTASTMTSISNGFEMNCVAPSPSASFLIRSLFDAEHAMTGAAGCSSRICRHNSAPEIPGRKKSTI